MRLTLEDKIFRDKGDAVNSEFRRQMRSLVVSFFYCRTSSQALPRSDVLTHTNFLVWICPNCLLLKKRVALNLRYPFLYSIAMTKLKTSAIQAAFTYRYAIAAILTSLLANSSCSSSASTVSFSISISASLSRICLLPTNTFLARL